MRRKIVVVVAISVVNLIQVIVDTRWQMMFVYLIPIFSILYMFALKYNRHSRKKWKKVLGVSLIIIYVFFSFALPCFLPMYTFPQPTGNHAVGTKILYLQGNRHELMIQVWYPTEAIINQERSPYMVDGPEVTASLSHMLGFPSFTLRHLEVIATHAYMDAPLSPRQSSYPVLLFSHGLGGVRNQNTFQLEELASHGYIVIGFDHPTYAAATVFPDGEVMKNQYPNLPRAGYEELDTHMRTWASNSKFVLDHLEALNQSAPFHNTMDLGRIGMLGHSYGGATAVYMLLHDDRIKVAMNMDGGIFGLDNMPQKLHKPLLLMAADTSLDQEIFYETLASFTDEEVFEQTGQTKAWHKENMKEVFARRERMLKAGANSIILPNTNHISFSDLPMYAPVLLAPNGDPAEVHTAVNQVTLRFFDDHLK
ncbi:alpha/beta fold hydrolase [Hazenella sp. IB182357]|uniref:Alpha/beta fold hydrolase n=2 Tax=Polycladospora coralii TaxID=2771432 RepID=A0A926NB55_9BACL|nr:alpha/beta fold hydrolase [Polycladospora coralii]